MLKFDTEDVDEHYRFCTLFSCNDQKKVCFTKAHKWILKKKKMYSYIINRE